MTSTGHDWVECHLLAIRRLVFPVKPVAGRNLVITAIRLNCERTPSPFTDHKRRIFNVITPSCRCRMSETGTLMCDPPLQRGSPGRAPNMLAVLNANDRSRIDSSQGYNGNWQLLDRPTTIHLFDYRHLAGARSAQPFPLVAIGSLVRRDFLQLRFASMYAVYFPR